MPPALAKKVERYNELHGHSPKTPKTDKLQNPYQARHSTIKPTANIVEQETDEKEEPTSTKENNTKINNTHDDALSSPPPIQHDINKVNPSCDMAEVPDVGDDYMEFLFPSVGMAAIELSKTKSSSLIPSTYVDYLTPTANMATTTPLTSKTSTCGESNELFTHDILTNHKQISKNFQADWGASIIIVNDKNLFTDFIACEASLNPVEGIPINKIKGYGTVVIFGSGM